jgi:hypothetical protein
MIEIPYEIQELFRKFAFRGNENLRGDGSVVDYTPEMLKEYIKCKKDPIYFISNYIKVVHPDRGVVLMGLYDYQKRMVKCYKDNKKVVFLTSRQQGKCVHINTKVKLRSKSKNAIIEVTLGELYAWEKFKEGPSEEIMQKMSERIYDGK